MPYKYESHLEHVLRAMFYLLAPISQVTTHAGRTDLFINAMAIEIKNEVDNTTDHNAKEQATRYIGSHWVITIGVAKKGRGKEYLQVRVPKKIWKELNISPTVAVDNKNTVIEDPEDPDYIVANFAEEDAYQLVMALLDWILTNAPHIFNDITLRPFYDPYAITSGKSLLDSFILDRAQAMGIDLPLENGQWTDKKTAELLTSQDIFIKPEENTFENPTIARRLQEDLRELVKMIVFADNKDALEKAWAKYNSIVDKYDFKRNEELWRNIIEPYQKLVVMAYGIETLAIHSGVQIAMNSFTNRNIQLIKSKTKERINTQKQNILTLEAYTRFFNTFATKYGHMVDALFINALLHVHNNSDRFVITKKDNSYLLFSAFAKENIDNEKIKDEIVLSQIPTHILTDIQAAMSTILSGIFTFGDPGKAISVQVGKNISAEIMYKNGQIMVMATSGLPKVFDELIVGRWMNYRELAFIYKDDVVVKKLEERNKARKRKTSEKTKENIREIMHMIVTAAAALDLIHGDYTRLHLIADMLRNYSNTVLYFAFKGEITSQETFDKLISNVFKKLPPNVTDEEKLKSFAYGYLDKMGKDLSEAEKDEFVQQFAESVINRSIPNFSDNNNYNVLMVSALYSLMGQLTLADALSRVQQGEDISVVYHKWFISDILTPLSNGLEDYTSEFTFMGLNKEEIELLSIVGSNYAVTHKDIEASLEVFRKYAVEGRHKEAAIILLKALGKLKGEEELNSSNFSRLDAQYFIAVANLAEMALTRGLLDDELIKVFLPVLTIGIGKARIKKMADVVAQIYGIRGKLLEKQAITKLQTQNTGTQKANKKILKEFTSLVGGAFVAQMLGYDDVGEQLWKNAEEIMRKYAIDKETIDAIVKNINTIADKIQKRPKLVAAMQTEISREQILSDVEKEVDVAAELVDAGLAHYERVINDLEKKLKEKDKKLKEKDEVIKEKDEAIKEKEKKLKSVELRLNKTQQDLYKSLQLLAKPILNQYLSADAGLNQQEELIAAYFIAKKRLFFDDNARAFCQLVETNFKNLIEAHKDIVLRVLAVKMPEYFGKEENNQNAIEDSIKDNWNLSR